MTLMKKQITIISVALIAAFAHAEETRTVIDRDSKTILGTPYKWGWQAWGLTDDKAREFAALAVLRDWSDYDLDRALAPYDQDKTYRVWEYKRILEAFRK